jgi:hypothetical protein
VQVYNVGQKVVTRNTTGYIPSQIAFFLQVLSEIFKAFKPD